MHIAAPILALVEPVRASFGGQELLIILAIVALLFGASRLPKLARSMGSSVNEFKRGMREGGVDDDADGSDGDGGELDGERSETA